VDVAAALHTAQRCVSDSDVGDLRPTVADHPVRTRPPALPEVS
jgi:hypothetical protein